MTDKEILLSLPHKKEQRDIFLKYSKFKTCKRITFSDLVELNYVTYKGVPIIFARIRNFTSGFLQVYAMFLPSECLLGRFLLHERARACKGRRRAETAWARLYVVASKRISEVSLTGRSSKALGDGGGEGGIWIMGEGNQGHWEYGKARALVGRGAQSGEWSSAFRGWES